MPARRKNRGRRLDIIRQAEPHCRAATRSDFLEDTALPVGDISAILLAETGQREWPLVEALHSRDAIAEIYPARPGPFGTLALDGDTREQRALFLIPERHLDAARAIERIDGG